MKKTKIVALLTLAGFSGSLYAAEATEASANPYEGYWVQFDEDKDSGRGKVQGVIHTYLATNDTHGKKGTLEMNIAVPIMKINSSGEIVPADIRFQKGGAVKAVKGEINGFKYDYTSNKTNFTQGLVFSGNLQKVGAGYDKGGVLNPNDGKTYSANAIIADGGKTLDVRAYYGWFGKDAHWKKITPEQYEAVKEKCGLTADNLYPYQDEDGKLKDSKLFKECYNYDFGVPNPTA
ncbi:DUF2147 domain-containing protein [Francisella sp. Scap27]|uniref:DUF2147 domain-containing protein n=1 Tax=Francisella sp. Scap27 TaxID=2589986 RepID=UPI0015BA0A5E|nr:DUF2147 domain-containing protein [Francisella sp. Scap27]QLE78508.1 DUF2147 domain-containing protein [Francisella sp. Scap27]